jgi:hypothetical protein
MPPYIGDSTREPRQNHPFDGTDVRAEARQGVAEPSAFEEVKRQLLNVSVHVCTEVENESPAHPRGQVAVPETDQADPQREACIEHRQPRERGEVGRCQHIIDEDLE